MTPDHQPPSVTLVALPGETIHSLAAGDLTAANATAPVLLPPFFVGPECIRVWQMRAKQIAADPGDLDWITRAVVDARDGVVVGCAGYHGPPDSEGMVEIGYAIDPLWRRSGYARAALEALLERAGREQSVRTVRATIRPDNLASRRLIAGYGFAEVGEQWDDEDGLETIFEAAAAG
ncbi:GNAT family N-acetyltransferase [Nocardia australiensis]|uniref:GNAT family N-acetyltransferase n=1 Tax=Nocardia australiensis TaxID=2887191 RepID=UPI001D15D883|nr:GNAT family N-acetyltransferase [Nocardia australiensis]